MKTRTKFVSNSSSSSFIIAITNKIEKCKTCGHEEGIKIDDLIDLIENNNNYDTEIAHYELTSETFKSENTYMEEKDVKEITDKIDNKSADERIMEIKVSYHNAFINGLINDSKNIEVINKENE